MYIYRPAHIFARVYEVLLAKVTWFVTIPTEVSATNIRTVQWKRGEINTCYS